MKQRKIQVPSNVQTKNTPSLETLTSQTIMMITPPAADVALTIQKY